MLPLVLVVYTRATVQFVVIIIKINAQVKIKSEHNLISFFFILIK